MKRSRTAFAPKNRAQPRSGAMLVFAMMALLIVSMIGASLLRTAVASLRQVHREQQQMQTGWLADAGCQRGIIRAQTKPDDTGEEWIVPADQLQSKSAGIVRITIVPDPQSDSSRIITAVAEYPQNAVQRTRVSKQMTVRLPKQEAK